MNAFKICAALLVIIWFLGLGHRDLIEPDEARYAEIPREMVQTGDWITPRLNDLKYFEKPALQYWLTAINYKLFGHSNATARLWIALASLACAAFIGFLGLRLYGAEVGRYGFFLSASTLLFCGSGHYLTLDMSLAFFMTLGVGFPILALSDKENPRRSRNFMLAGWAALACAVLTKGLVGAVLPGGALFFYILWQRDWKLLKELHIVKGVLLFLLICAPWFIVVSKANPEFAHFFFIHEHLERYTTNTHHREGPVYYFVGVFIIGVLPWLITSSRGVLLPTFSWRTSKGETFNPERFMWVYIVTTFVFFSLGDSKLPAYILPILPFVSLLAAKRIASEGRIKGDSWVMLVTAILIFVVALISSRFASEKIPAELIALFRPWLMTAAISLAIGSAALFKWRNTPSKSVPIASVFSVLAISLMLWGFQAIAISRSSADEAKVIRKYASDSTPVYAIDNYPQALPFYLERPITLVSYTGELEMGVKAEPDKTIPTKKEFWKRWDQDEQAVAVIRSDDLHLFKSRGEKIRVIFKGPRRIVVMKQ
ncbi:ArnT family glycosyltransferase [Microbulbifer hainanensis]|uniref:ArnT family glycosyltransferase n=1 Tax=Microbulbifer hainanensis TaxID=2735675 RepID=UPI001865FD35|nr:glycosyltransferase family 39 protein [Microbulbifer hainanensis]